MPDTESRQELTGSQIKSLISSLTDTPNLYGFEVFVITKSSPRLKKMKFFEPNRNDFCVKLKNSIFGILSNKYNAEDADYVPADRIADEQMKFYIIDTDDGYDPFDFLNSAEGIFSKDDFEDATGIAFKIQSGEKKLWAYQHLWPIMVPSKTKKTWRCRMISDTEGDSFEELTNPVITIAERIDLLVIDDHIISSNYKLLQNSFGFQDYIRKRAEKTIQAIEEKRIVANAEKMREYIQRGDGKPKYAKKMMRISDSKVLKMDSNRLWEKIHQSTRWNGKIKERDGKFLLEHYSDVEALIDLLDERFTRSDITDIEYDTDVKQVAKPVARKRMK